MKVEHLLRAEVHCIVIHYMYMYSDNVHVCITCVVVGIVQCIQKIVCTCACTKFLAVEYIIHVHHVYM